MADENRQMAAVLQGGLLPAPPATPEMIQAALASPLANNHLRYPGDDPIAELSQQRFARADPLGFAMGIAGGPKGFAPLKAGAKNIPITEHGAYDSLSKSPTPLPTEAENIADLGYLEAARLRNKDYEPFRQQRARQQGFTTDAVHGTRLWDSNDPVPRIKINKTDEEPAFFSTPNPELASMYAGAHPKVNEAAFGPNSAHIPEGAQSVPVKLNTKDYHVYDAKGKSWTSANISAIRQAQDAGKPGVIIKNVMDEPAATDVLGPQTTYLALDPSTVRSPFAKFDPKNVGKNSFMGSMAGAAALPPTALAMIEALRGQEQK